MEHLALDTGEHEDRQVDDHDDQLAVNEWPAGLARRLEHGVEALFPRQRAPEARLLGGDAAHAVLHDHHRAVDDDPEIERAQAQQVGADIGGDHAGKREQRRQRNDHCREQRRAQVPEKEEQHRDHEYGALQQVVADRDDGALDQH